MGIITVSRELAALGDETARQIAKQLGYRLFNKDTLEERIKSYGIDTQKLNKFDKRKPSFVASLSGDRDNYLHYLKTALFAEAEQGNCVFISRGAGVVLKKLPGHIRVFLAAPLEIRIERVKSYFHCDERRAQHIIEHSDKDRIGFHRYFFDIDWREPGNYHIALNTGMFHPAACAEIICRLTEQVFTPEAEAQNNARLKDLILEQKIKHHIMYDKEIPVHFLEAAVSGNTATLYGVVNSQAMIDAALNAACEAIEQTGDKTDGEKKTVQSEMQVVREYSVIP